MRPPSLQNNLNAVHKMRRGGRHTVAPRQLFGNSSRFQNGEMGGPCDRDDRPWANNNNNMYWTPQPVPAPQPQQPRAYNGYRPPNNNYQNNNNNNYYSTPVTWHHYQGGRQQADCTPPTPPQQQGWQGWQQGPQQGWSSQPAPSAHPPSQHFTPNWPPQQQQQQSQEQHQQHYQPAPSTKYQPNQQPQQYSWPPNGNGYQGEYVAYPNPSRDPRQFAPSRRQQQQQEWSQRHVTPVQLQDNDPSQEYRDPSFPQQEQHWHQEAPRQEPRRQSFPSSSGPAVASVRPWQVEAPVTTPLATERCRPEASQNAMTAQQLRNLSANAIARYRTSSPPRGSATTPKRSRWDQKPPSTPKLQQADVATARPSSRTEAAPSRPSSRTEAAPSSLQQAHVATAKPSSRTEAAPSSLQQAHVATARPSSRTEAAPSSLQQAHVATARPSSRTEAAPSRPSSRTEAAPSSLQQAHVATAKPSSRTEDARSGFRSDVASRPRQSDVATPKAGSRPDPRTEFLRASSRSDAARSDPRMDATSSASSRSHVEAPPGRPKHQTPKPTSSKPPRLDSHIPQLPPSTPPSTAKRPRSDAEVPQPAPSTPPSTSKRPRSDAEVPQPAPSTPPSTSKRPRSDAEAPQPAPSTPSSTSKRPRSEAEIPQPPPGSSTSRPPTSDAVLPQPPQGASVRTPQMEAAIPQSSSASRSKPGQSEAASTPRRRQSDADSAIQDSDRAHVKSKRSSIEASTSKASNSSSGDVVKDTADRSDSSEKHASKSSRSKSKKSRSSSHSSTSKHRTKTPERSAPAHEESAKKKSSKASSSTRDSKTRSSSSSKISSSTDKQPKEDLGKSSNGNSALNPPKFNANFRIPKTSKLPNPLLDAQETPKSTKKSPTTWLQQGSTPKPAAPGSKIHITPSCSASEESPQDPENRRPKSSGSDYELMNVLSGETAVDLAAEVRAARRQKRTCTSCAPEKTKTKKLKETELVKKQSTTKTKTRPDSEENARSRLTPKRRSRKGSDESDWTPPKRSRSARSRCSNLSSEPPSPPRSGIASRTRSRTRSPSAKRTNVLGFSNPYDSSDSDDDDRVVGSTWTNESMAHWATGDDTSEAEKSPPSAVEEMFKRLQRDNQKKKEIVYAQPANYTTLSTCLTAQESLLASPPMPFLLPQDEISPANRQEMPHLTRTPSSGPSIGDPTSSPPSVPSQHERQVTTPPPLGREVSPAIPMLPQEKECQHRPASDPKLSGDTVVAATAEQTVNEVAKKEDKEHAGNVEEIVLEDISEDPGDVEVVGGVGCPLSPPIAEFIDLEDQPPIDVHLPIQELWNKLQPSIRNTIETLEDTLKLANSSIVTFVEQFNEAEKMKTRSLREEQFQSLRDDFRSKFSLSYQRTENAFLHLLSHFKEKDLYCVLRKRLCTTTDLSDPQSSIEDMKTLFQTVTSSSKLELTRNCSCNVSLAAKLFNMHRTKREYQMDLNSPMKTAGSRVQGVEPLPHGNQAGGSGATSTESTFNKRLRTPSRDSGYTSPHRVLQPSNEDPVGSDDDLGHVEIPTCIQCIKTATLRCPACPDIYYCSTNCQKMHWVSHINTCGYRNLSSPQT
ncbi:serine/arginine repetitive matrix protein 2-like isoform X2 [Thrips palmi]|uniref:Serine/arginine repetitive matrix protein 2-like isoform X2 n=1 Tax=Thrips palmi TaxID=161013 RepID=A0A6P8YQ79_THRPL|nr:serine/arginine repetitive matrix protein 2-like isoform X2 [Thrips palmi]